MFRTVLAVLTFSVVAGATPVLFNTVGGVDAQGNPVSASGSVNVADGGLVTVTLNNLQTGIFAADQLLSDFFFTLSSAPGVPLNTTSTPTGSLVTVASGGVVTSSNATITGWALTSSGGTIHLDSLADGPSQTIIGSVSNAPNASITGNHNPYLNGSATFSFTIAGVTSGTTVSNGIFSFGTDAGDNITGCVVGGPSCHSSTVPEPVTSALVGSGLLALFFVRRRVRG
jgi:hypothetical protein